VRSAWPGRQNPAGSQRRRWRRSDFAGGRRMPPAVINSV
jgi:hypothetical protein